MKIKQGFEVVNIAEEYLMLPIGKEAESFKGIVALSEEAAFLLNNMKSSKSEEDLVQLLLNEYDVDEESARADINTFLYALSAIGIIE